MKRIIIAGLFAVSVAFGVVSQASADPIVCPGQQVAVNPSDGGWVCVNPAGHTDNSEQPKH